MKRHGLKWYKPNTKDSGRSQISKKYARSLYVQNRAKQNYNFVLKVFKYYCAQLKELTPKLIHPTLSKTQEINEVEELVEYIEECEIKIARAFPNEIFPENVECFQGFIEDEILETMSEENLNECMQQAYDEINARNM